MVWWGYILRSGIGLVFGLDLRAGFDLPFGWFCHTELATLKLATSMKHLAAEETEAGQTRANSRLSIGICLVITMVYG